MPTNANVIIVLGYKLNDNGLLHSEFIAKLDQALSELRAKPTSYLVITGGKTQLEYPSEAVVAKEYLRTRLATSEISLLDSILLEEQSLATADHPKYVRQLLRDYRIFPERFTIITSRFHVKRSKLIFNRLWPEIAGVTTWMGTGKVTITDTVKEGILRSIFLLDPDSITIMPFLKSIFRNG